MSTVDETFRRVRQRLQQVLGPDEGDAAARIIFEDTAGYDRKYLFMNGDREMLPFTAEKIDRVADRVAAGEPVQYAVGKARFMGNDYRVTPAVLIPRPETAGLVDMICKEYDGRSDLRVLDIGTGSGCIAISLARALPFSSVTAFDISAEALAVARDNARSLGVSVDFRQTDILKAEPGGDSRSFDIVVSNPPYICRSEAADMDARVLDHEPAQALFVPDDGPLLFYTAIGRYALGALKPGGTLWFEINALYHADVVAMLLRQSYSDAEAYRDYRGLYRYVRAVCSAD